MADNFGDSAGFPDAELGASGVDRGRLAGLFLRLYARRFTGRAYVSSQSRTMTVAFREGVPVMVDSSAPESSLADDLVARGILTKDEYADLIGRVTEDLVENEDVAICEHAVSLGYLSEEQIRRELSERVRSKLIQSLALVECEVELDDAPDALSGVAEYPQNVGAAVYMGVRTFYEEDVLREYVPDLKRSYLRLTKSPAEIARFFELDYEEVALLNAIDSQRRAADWFEQSDLETSHALQLIGLLLIGGMCEFSAHSFAPPAGERSGVRSASRPDSNRMRAGTPVRETRPGSRGGIPAVREEVYEPRSASRAGMPAVQSRPDSVAAVDPRQEPNTTPATSRTEGSGAFNPPHWNEEGSGAQNPPRGNESSGAHSPPRRNEGSGAFNPPRRNEGSGAFNPPNRNEGSGAFNPPRRNEGSGAHNAPRANEGSGAWNPPRRPIVESNDRNEGSGAFNPPRRNEGSGAHNAPRPNEGSGAHAAFWRTPAADPSISRPRSPSATRTPSQPSAAAKAPSRPAANPQSSSAGMSEPGGDPAAEALAEARARAKDRRGAPHIGRDAKPADPRPPIAMEPEPSATTSRQGQAPANANAGARNFNGPQPTAAAAAALRNLNPPQANTAPAGPTQTSPEYQKAHLKELMQRRQQAAPAEGGAGPAAPPRRDAVRDLRSAHEALRDGQYARAEELLRTLVDQSPNDDILHTYHLWAQLRASMPLEPAQIAHLRELAKRLVADAAHASFACYVLAHLYLADKKDDQAEKYFRKAHALDKTNTDAERHIVILERRKNNANEADSGNQRKFLGITLGKPKE